MSSTNANAIFLASLAVYVVMRGIFEERTKHNEKLVRRGGPLEIAVIALMFMGSFALPLLYVFTRLLSFADYKTPIVVTILGTLVMFPALWLFWRSHGDLGLNWSRTLEIRTGHQLVTHGVYSRVRHPMYGAIFLFGIGQAMLLANWLAGPSAFIAFALMYYFRTSREEAMMLERFGTAYRDYAARTGRLFPRASRRP